MIPKYAKIYIAGHTGLVGSAILRKYLKEGYKNLIYSTRSNLNLLDQCAVTKFMRKEKPEYVIIAAGKVGGIKPNIIFPAEFLYENTTIQNNLIWSALKFNVKKLLYISCGCAYPTKSKQPMKEEYILTGLPEPTNEGFALAKISGIKLCEKIFQEYERDFISCIPANTYGPFDHFSEDRSHVIPALIHKFTEGKENNSKEIVLWGTGNSEREFIYVDDLAEAIYLVMENYKEPQSINIGSGEIVSIHKLANLIKKITGYKEKVRFDSTKPDGMLRRVLDSTKIENLGFKPKIKLIKGLKVAEKYYRSIKSTLNRTQVT